MALKFAITRASDQVGGEYRPAKQDSRLWSGAATLCLFLSTISGLVARLIRIAITAAAYEAMPPRCPFGSVG
jgi:hypothetical protein